MYLYVIVGGNLINLTIFTGIKRAFKSAILGLPVFFKMAAKKKFNIPTVDELDEKSTPKLTSKRAFKLFRKIKDTNETSGDKEGSRIDNIREKNCVKNKPTETLEVRECQSLDTREQNNGKLSSFSTNTSVSSCSTSTTNLTTASSSKPGEDSSTKSTENNVGKSFKDTFAFLKNTRHYEEAEAKMKEIE